MQKFLVPALMVFAAIACVGEDVHPITHRQIAQPMGPAGADWLVRPEREVEEHPDAALNALKIPKGAVVADVGAGVGYFTWRLAARVGPSGLVYGEDIQPEMLSQLSKNMKDRRLTNVRAVLGTIDDPKLPANALDLVILVDVYHEFSEPEKMLDRIRESLKPNGRLVLLEYRGEDPKVPIQPLHRMTLEQVKQEVQPEGFRFEQSIEILPEQHIIVFRR